MYEDLVKRLHKRIALTTAGSPLQDDLKEAADAIEELCKLNAEITRRELKLRMDKPRWVPVTERLPKDDDKRFLVCAKWFNGEPYMCICYHAKNLHEFDEYDFPNENRPGWYFYDSEYGWVEKEDVTHWMPLPEPPKEET